MQVGDLLLAAFAGEHAVIKEKRLRIRIGNAGFLQLAVFLENLDDIRGGLGIQCVFVPLGIIAQLVKAFAELQYVAAPVADVQRFVGGKLVVGISEGDFVFDVSDGIAGNHGKHLANLSLGDGKQLDRTHLTQKLGENIALFIALALFDMQPELTVALDLADGVQGGVCRNDAQTGAVRLLAQVGALERAHEARLVIERFAGYCIGRGRPVVLGFAVRFGCGSRLRGGRRGRRGGWLGRRRGNRLEQTQKHIAFASAFGDTDIDPCFITDIHFAQNGDNAVLFQGFELIAFGVGQLAQVRLLGGAQLTVFLLLGGRRGGVLAQHG